ncbi:ATP-binding protein [Paenibacillus riograndensis]|uniref:ATPase/histidine kinase/DNA gyrase B/HSP90 domain protein n=1 Tax=Paenibacillus riograndensis SBR5 TaxID=1073571 RepID=A0A0E4HAP6_9BACL|nr:ATP-binding protein [Paenibacillus riograndensis]CQR56000.1 ATPase/histidine kinase/DNA gyrase B/HSP90 domain protein [Paenibacillus riograndensis SBR5]
MIADNWLVVLCVEVVMGLQILYFFNSVFGKSAQKQKRWMYFLVFGVLDFVYFSVPVPFQISSILALVVIFCLAEAYNVEIKTKIIFTVLYGVLMSIVNMISIYFFYVLDSVDLNRLDTVDEQNQFLLFKATLLSFTMMFAVIQIIRLIAKRRSFSLHYRYYILLILIPIISIYQLNVLTNYNEMNIHYFISAIGFLFINVMIIYIFDTIVDKFQFKHENARLEQQMDYQDANYEKTVHSFKSIKRIIHDTNQQLLYIEECIKRNEPAAALEHIRTTLNKVEGAYQRVNTGHLVIDALVTNTLNIGQANGIRIDTKLNLYSPELSIDRYDLCVVLGNMLDNAIEASKQVKIAEDRYVVITIFSNDTALFIHIVNYMEQDVAYLRSQKPNPENHGIGLTNIARICDKYGGHMTIETKQKTFHNMVMLPFWTSNP